MGIYIALKNLADAGEWPCDYTIVSYHGTMVLYSQGHFPPTIRERGSNYNVYNAIDMLIIDMYNIISTIFIISTILILIDIDSLIDTN